MDQEPYVAVRRFARACVRYWVVVLIGLCATGAAVSQVGRVAGVFYGEQVVLLVLPQKSDSNPLSDYSDSLIATASVIQREMQNGPEPPRVVSNDLRLVDTGLKNGQKVTLRNDGGQWNNWFDRAELRLEAVGPSQEAVQARMDSMAKRVGDLLQQRQSTVGQQHQISMKEVPSKAVISYETGKHRQAQLTTLVLGLGLIAAVVNLLGGRGAGGFGRSWRVAIPAGMTFGRFARARPSRGVPESARVSPSS